MAVEMNDGQISDILAQINGRTKLTELQKTSLENMVLYVLTIPVLLIWHVTALPLAY